MPDSVIASEAGVTRQAVSYARERMGIASSRLVLSAEHQALLGRVRDVDLARMVGCSAWVITVRRRAAGIPSYRISLDVPHGVTRHYYQMGCRCVPCNQLNARCMREYIRRHPERRVATRERARAKALASAPHALGSVSKYGLGCRCDGCRVAQSAYNREYYRGVILVEKLLDDRR